MFEIQITDEFKCSFGEHLNDQREISTWECPRCLQSLPVKTCQQARVLAVINIQGVRIKGIRHGYFVAVNVILIQSKVTTQQQFKIVHLKVGSHTFER